MKKLIESSSQKIFLLNKKKLLSFFLFLFVGAPIVINPLLNNEKNLNNYKQIFNNKIKNKNSRFLDGIEPTTIDHRVVDINLESWMDSNGVIKADKLDGYKKVTTDSFQLYFDDVTEINFPNSMETIEAGAIVSARQTLKKVFIPASVINITGNIFVDCEPQQVIFEKGSKYKIENGCVYETAQKKLLMILPNEIKGDTIRIRDDTQIIAPYAFSNLHAAGRLQPFKLVQSDFKNVVEIQNYGFYNANISSFEITNKIKKMGVAAFSGFAGTLTSTNSNFTIDNYQKFDVLVEKSKDNALSLVNPRWSKNEIVPFNLNYTYIGDSFCDSYNTLTMNQMIFGDKVKEIGASAFSNLTLNEIIFNDGLIRVDDYSFNNINTLNSRNGFEVTFPNSTQYIGEAVFYNCGAGVVNIPSAVKHIGTGINLNSWKVNINLDPNNQYYKMKNGLLIEVSSSSVIGYDYDWLIDPTSKGIFIVDEDIRYIQPRSLTMLMANPNFKGIEIKNKNIVIGNGAFLNSGVTTTNQPIDIKVPNDMPLKTQRYIITSVMSWEFGPYQDTNLTGYGGGSWRGTVNGRNDLVPIPKPDPFPSPGQNTTEIKFNVPQEFFRYTPSIFAKFSLSYFNKWFTIINGSINPPTTVNIKYIKYNNLDGTLALNVDIINALVANNLSDKPINKNIVVNGFKTTTKTTMQQIKIPNPKIDVPSITELNQYISWTDTGDVINHDYLKYNSVKPEKIYSTFLVSKILNTKTSTGYLDNFHDGLLHIKVKVDNYYNQEGNFIEQGQYGYEPLYLILKLQGFNLIEIVPEKDDGNGTLLIIVFVVLFLIIIALILSIIIMTRGIRRRR